MYCIHEHVFAGKSIPRSLKLCEKYTGVELVVLFIQISEISNNGIV